MSKYAYVDYIKEGVVFSDPWYDENVKCQYRKAFIDKNWYMKLDTNSGEYNSLQFKMIFGRSTLMNSLNVEETEKGYTFQFPERYSMSDVELGIDTACIYMGNMLNFEHFGESIAFKTGSDGLFGDLFVFTVKGEAIPAGFVLFGVFDKDFVLEEYLFSQLKASFDGKEISKEEFDFGISEKRIENKMTLARELNHAQHFTENKGQEGPMQAKSSDEPER